MEKVRSRRRHRGPCCKSRKRQIGTCLDFLMRTRMRGLAEKTYELIAFARTLLAENHPMTLRQLHYAIFSAAKIEYDNTPKDYKRLSRATTVARRFYRTLQLAGRADSLGSPRIIPPEWIVDETRETRVVNVW